MLTVGFVMMMSVKTWSQKTWFCCFSMTLKPVIFVPVLIQKVIFCKKRWLFCSYWISQFEGLSMQFSQLIVKAMFVWLRKLQCFKAVESCTASFGRHGRQWGDRYVCEIQVHFKENIRRYKLLCQAHWYSFQWPTVITVTSSNKPVSIVCCLSSLSFLAA